MKPTNHRQLTKIVGLALLLMFGSARAELTDEIHTLQTRWAEVNYQMTGKTQLSAFEQLIKDADQVITHYPNQAEGWIWSGIIKSTYAGARGGFGALGYAKESKKALEKALSIAPDALDGSAYTSLGTLYFNVPGWPIGFGDDDKAEELLKKALAINPNGIDSNYFYGDFLISQKRYREAKQFLEKARQAAPRPGRPLADAGRQKEISQRLAIVTDKLK